MEMLVLWVLWLFGSAVTLFAFKVIENADQAAEIKEVREWKKRFH